MRAWNRKRKPKFTTKAKYSHEFGIISCRKMKKKYWCWHWGKIEYSKNFERIVISPANFGKGIGFVF